MAWKGYLVTYQARRAYFARLRFPLVLPSPAPDLPFAWDVMILRGSKLGRIQHGREELQGEGGYFDEQRVQSGMPVVSPHPSAPQSQ